MLSQALRLQRVSAFFLLLSSFAFAGIASAQFGSLYTLGLRGIPVVDLQAADGKLFAACDTFGVFGLTITAGFDTVWTSLGLAGEHVSTVFAQPSDQNNSFQLYAGVQSRPFSPPKVYHLVDGMWINESTNLVTAPIGLLRGLGSGQIINGALFLPNEALARKVYNSTDWTRMDTLITIGALDAEGSMVIAALQPVNSFSSIAVSMDRGTTFLTELVTPEDENGVGVLDVIPATVLPDDPQTIVSAIAGYSGGVSRRVENTAFGAVGWSQTFKEDGILVRALAHDDGDRKHLYAFTTTASFLGNKIFESRDLGRSWQQVVQFSDLPPIRRAESPKDSVNKLYLATDRQGVYAYISEGSMSVAGSQPAAATAWPNPFNDRLHLTALNALSIIDILGREVAFFPAGEHEWIPNASQPNGVYSVVQFGSDALLTRILLQR